MVKRVRGVAYSSKVSPQTSKRMVDGARGVLNQVSPRWGQGGRAQPGEPPLGSGVARRRRVRPGVVVVV